ncbi:pyruvate dehydrogenase complex dihydrolipoamide acetyltransferase [Pseudobacteriovorax antillogorgiicola]|uniref:Acetyltransferase component of pyruvate dehydrogenase complex n=1 Tax=Pseudobacteriovorax antillogorgiicola TaxID=1513793 RepID=A0A1Y6CR57_9BACT|nr:pyruvate dehydrogenase complex dihydrolipoamide acetyltransferase [Pseudobacteriovorax antillogorgiicola]TCS41469.1 pyruvate dehydrogenase E2 component (dihydrolipoamide acetyltransferase) [Pseudobacteriovorax antillogorgiicola]SMF83638.1 pyruvate dehydrogenase E2 component (dihydrolipoamide acetyltransferase) [Pseudobacteriovorax antillogorgiicola]
MAEIIEMPKLSDTMEEGAIASWLKEEGDFIEEGEAFVEIETDKATMEYNSPEEGTLLKILVKGGEACELNAPICVIGEKGEDFDLDKLLAKSGGSKSESKADESEKSDEKASSGDEGSAKQEASAPKSQSSGDGSRVKASPLAKKMAEDNNISLDQIDGSGPGGRIIQKDVEQAMQSGGGKPKPGDTVDVPKPIPLPQFGDQDKPNSMMRKTIAKRLLAGKNDAPHFYLTRSVNMAKLLEWRKSLNAEVESYRGDNPPPKVSVNDLIVQACGKALMKHPEVNASWQGDFIRQFGSADISVAVAIPDGLITPVVRGAHILGARDIARQTKDLVGRAKSGGLKPEEYQGGTFSISNLGMMGIEEFTAIINPPQAAILAVGATIPTPWVGDSGEIEVQQRMKFTMSCDHRVIDGAVGAQFLQTLAAYLENPLMMLS